MGKLAIGEGRPYGDLHAKAAERTASQGPKLVHEKLRILSCTELLRGLNNAPPGCYRHTICHLSVGARTMTEAQALGLLFVVLLFVAYGVWDLSHHR